MRRVLRRPSFPKFRARRFGSASVAASSTASIRCCHARFSTGSSRGGSMPKLRLRIYIHGAGKVGRALAHALRWAGARVTLRPARAALPRKLTADLVILAVRDRDLAGTAIELATVVPENAVCVHVAGAVGP